jgi:acetolactate synthase regulatory subunit
MLWEGGGCVVCGRRAEDLLFTQLSVFVDVLI